MTHSFVLEMTSGHLRIKAIFSKDGAFVNATSEFPEIAVQIGANTSQKGQ